MRAYLQDLAFASSIFAWTDLESKGEITEKRCTLNRLLGIPETDLGGDADDVNASSTRRRLIKILITVK